MNSPPLDAHSISEIHLYLAITPCDACGGGPLECAADTKPVPNGYVTSARCSACGHERWLTFTLPADEPLHNRDVLYPTINRHGEPSRIIDVGQWITLFRVILEAADKENDKIESRRLGLEAAQCLEEAMKFYRDDELPADDAVFCDATRKRLREHPEQFAKQRLADMRAKLPTLSTMQHQIARDAGLSPAKRPWWRFWSR